MDELTRYEGTPWECVAWLERYFSIMRNIAKGMRETSDDIEFCESLIDALEKSVYRVTVEPLGMVTSDVARPENSYIVMRMQTALELFDAIQKHQDEVKTELQNHQDEMNRELEKHQDEMKRELEKHQDEMKRELEKHQYEVRKELDETANEHRKDM